MRSYKQLTYGQRYQIYILKQAGHNQKEIATMLQVDKSTISRELSRNKGKKGYRPKQAHHIAMNRRLNKSSYRIQHSTWILVEHLIKNDCVRSGVRLDKWVFLSKDISLPALPRMLT